jgi:hypothetical protein
MTPSPAAIWVGRTLSTFVVVVLAADAVAQFLTIEAIRAEMTAAGFPTELAPAIAFVAAGCTLLYAIPQTAPLGAILITGFLGGAICTHLRLGEIASPPQLVSLALGLMTWGGLYLRNPQVRALIPIYAPISAREDDRQRPQPGEPTLRLR